LQQAYYLNQRAYFWLLPDMLYIFFPLFFLFHPLHISVSEFNYSEKDKELQITSRIFIDDLEAAIRIRRKEPEMDILDPKNGQTTDQVVQEYLNEHFKVKIDGKPQMLKILGHDKEDVALIFYIEIAHVKKIKTLEVTNTVITEIHNDQSNLVHVTYKSPIKSVRLTLEKPSDVFRFDGK
jgi:hypothetical protein